MDIVRKVIIATKEVLPLHRAYAPLVDTAVWKVTWTHLVQGNATLGIIVQVFL